METIVKVDKVHFVSATEVTLSFDSTDSNAPGCRTSHCMAYQLKDGTVSWTDECVHSVDGEYDDSTSDSGDGPLDKDQFLTWIIRDLAWSFDEIEVLVTALCSAFAEAVLKSL
jgi:hypothetical protein